MVAHFDGSGSTIDVDPCLSRRTMSVGGNNSHTRADNRRALQAQIERLVRAGIASRAAVAGSGLLAEYQFGARQLDAHAGTGLRLLLLSADFVAGAGCIDFRSLRIGDRGDSARAVRDCPAGGFVPDAVGFDVILEDAGRVADPSTVPSPTLEWLLVLAEVGCDSSGVDLCHVTSRPRGTIG